VEGLHEAGAQLERGAEDEVDDERPFAAVSVGDDAEGDLEWGF
jgi:hypothetical protein